MRLVARRRGRRRGHVPADLLHHSAEESAPELSLVNLVDLMLVFAVGLMLALVHQSAATEQVAGSKPVSTQRMKLVGEPQKGSGMRVGTAYRLEGGEIIYVPDAGEGKGK